MTRLVPCLAGALVVLATHGATVFAQTASPPTVEAGFGQGVTIRRADDEFSLNIRARIQLRSSALVTEGEDTADITEFQIRRMRVVFQGNALGPRLTYYIQLSFANLDMEPDLRSPLRDAYITWAPRRDLNVRAGQMKVPFSRQRVVSSSALQMVDRSIVVSELNLDRDVGVQLFSKDLFGTGKLGYAVGWFGGDGRNRVAREAGYLYSARLEAWPFGAFDDFVESDIRRDPRPRLAVAANVGYNQNTNRPRSTIGEPYPSGSFDYRHAAVDLMFKQRGWSVEAEWLYRRANEDRQIVIVGGVPTTIESRSGYGAYVQAGRMLTDRLELTGRYSSLSPFSGTATTFVESEELGAGVSYYAREHNLKLQGDYFVVDAGPARRLHQLRAQLQLFF